MANEVMQWVAIVVSAFVILGLLRQVALALPPDTLAVGPGPKRGDRVSEKIMSQLRNAGLPETQGEFLLIFVAENCLGCQSLLADLEQRGEGDALDIPVLLVSRGATPQFRETTSGMGVGLLDDVDGDVWRGLGVTSTPFVMRIDQDGRVRESEVTHRVENVSASAHAASAQRGEATVR
jgi:hypothetical protein